ncbi:hypothetical protein ACJX0J_021048, partial [Zea mays]
MIHAHVDPFFMVNHIDAYILSCLLGCTTLAFIAKRWVTMSNSRLGFELTTSKFYPTSTTMLKEQEASITKYSTELNIFSSIFASHGSILMVSHHFVFNYKNIIIIQQYNYGRLFLLNIIDNI